MNSPYMAARKVSGSMSRAKTTMILRPKLCADPSHEVVDVQHKTMREVMNDYFNHPEEGVLAIESKAI